MTKKRLIFVLLYSDGFFYLSRNFNLQKIGDIDWISTHYDFQKVARYLDELVVLNVSRNINGFERFVNDLKRLLALCFIPVAVGGGIRTCKQVHSLLSAGADKIVLNSLLFNSPSAVESIAKETGRQSVVASLDFKRRENIYIAFSECGKKEQDYSLDSLASLLSSGYVGELLINSIDTDGTGQGLDHRMLKVILPLLSKLNMPMIVMGGAGNKQHLLSAFQLPHVDAVATANLLNFIGQGIPNARAYLMENDIDLGVWHDEY